VGGFEIFALQFTTGTKDRTGTALVPLLKLGGHSSSWNFDFEDIDREPSRVMANNERP
jgi:altronate dehydratase